MTAPTNHWKLGLFVVVGGLLGVLAVVYFSTLSFRKETVVYTSYFDEAVGGLNVGSAVSFRGVTVGNVSDIGIAPDRRHVEVRYELLVSTLTQLGLVDTSHGAARMQVPEDVRVQISSSGVTGSKYVKLDFFAHAPVQKLPFAVSERTIPTMPSTMKNLEESVTRAVERLPEITEQISSVLRRVDHMVAAVEEGGLPSKAAETLTRASRAFGSMDRTMSDLKTKELSTRAASALASVEGAMNDGRKLVAKVGEDAGLLDSVQRTSDAMGDVATGARGTSQSLDRTLEYVNEAAGSIQRFLDTLEQDPDMLLKGRARSAE